MSKQKFTPLKKKPKVGDRVNYLDPKQEEPRLSDVLEVSADGRLISLQVIGASDPNTKTPLIINNVPFVDAEDHATKLRPNTWHWPVKNEEVKA
ncbi:MAG: hypothetical protein SFY81_04920 [Verrucomicrobiota bacterium]|nr:hypothetical protein [Verrucomicrobiota bacterium]